MMTMILTVVLKKKMLSVYDVVLFKDGTALSSDGLYMKSGQKRDGTYIMRNAIRLPDGTYIYGDYEDTISSTAIARYIPCRPFMDRDERTLKSAEQAVCVMLCENLPASWLVLSNAMPCGEDWEKECDEIVLDDKNNAWIIEVKDWSGNIYAADPDWTLRYPDGNTEKRSSPIRSTRLAVQKLAGLVKTRCPSLSKVYFRPLVVLAAQSKVSFDNEGLKQYVCYVYEVIDRLREVSAKSNEHLLSQKMQEEFIRSVISKQAADELASKRWKSDNASATPLFCQHCGAKLEEGAAFCSQCGEAVH